MRAKNNIVDQLREKIARAAQQSRRGVILQPGSIGDCIVTLPLVEFMKRSVCPGGVDLIGHTEYTGILPGRSNVDAVKSVDSMGLHRLFARDSEFALADGDPLIFAFAEYAWIVTFLGEPDSDFEQNLIFTANCSHSAEVMALVMKPAEGCDSHVSDFYREQFVKQSGLSEEEYSTVVSMPFIKATAADIRRGREVLAEFGVMPTSEPIVVHPGSGGMEKCWPLDNFLSAGRNLVDKGIDVIFLLGPAELERFSASTIAKIETIGRAFTNLSLADVVGLLSCATGYLGNDSGITHLSAGLGLRTVAVFGPTDPVVYGPVGPAVSILQGRGPEFASSVSEDLQEQAIMALLQ